jgi:hypothetical protein
MAHRKTREQIQAEISRLDEEIDRLVANMPPAAMSNVMVFPLKLWVIAAVLIALYLNGKGVILAPLHPLIADYGAVILIVGCCLAVLALLNSFRVLFGGKRKNKHFRQEAAKVDALKRQREALSHQLGQLKA